jgi:serine/threonine-protein kinase
VPAGIGAYRVIERIAVGGMAEVYRALTPQSHGADRAVVIKRMLPALVGDDECRMMFEEEARLGLLIDHPNVVEVIDRGEEDGAPFIVLEYVFGVDLWQLTRWLTRKRRAMDLPLALYLTTEMLGGLDAVHAVRDAQGNPLLAVHRDVSPSNVFLSVHGDVKLGDLGIARPLKKQLERPVAPLSLRAKGKLGYLAPEQIEGAEVDQRADVFAAAVVTAELLMGRPLFTGATELAVLLAIRDADLHPFEQHAVKLPPGLVTALRDAMAREPRERLESAAELRNRILPYIVGSVVRLKDDLGALVTEVLESGERAAGTVDRKALARTVDGSSEGPSSEEMLELVTPAGKLSTEELLELFTPSGVLRTPTPAVDKGGLGLDLGPRYEVQINEELKGPWTYAKVIRALVLGEVGVRDLVRKGSGPLKPLSKFPELARHLPPSSRTPTLKKSERMAETSESYVIEAGFGMLGVLARIFLERETGLLLCERGAVRKEVYVQDGTPVFVTSNQPGELLGEYLVTAGVIDRAELDLALAVMPRFEGRLGDTLAALGLVEPVQLVRHIEKKVKDQLLDVFLWTEGRAALYREAPAPQTSFTLKTDGWRVLEDGAAIRIDAGLDGAFHDGAKRALVRAPGPSLLPDPPARLQEMIVALSSPRSLAELAGVAGGEDRARVDALVLGALGVVRPKA